MVERWVGPVAESTIRKIMTANGPPEARGRFVTRINMGPRFFKACSFAASDAEVDEAGYSPPAPKPIIPRATLHQT